MEWSQWALVELWPCSFSRRLCPEWPFLDGWCVGLRAAEEASAALKEGVEALRTVKASQSNHFGRQGGLSRVPARRRASGTKGDTAMVGEEDAMEVDEVGLPLLDRELFGSLGWGSDSCRWCLGARCAVLS